MNWYLAKLIYQVTIGEGNHVPQFDAQYRLIRADELDWAWEKATTMGRLGETIFANEKAEEVKWMFIAVEEICPIDSLEDGSQLYGSTIEPDDVDEFIRITRERSKRFLARRGNKVLVL